MCAQQQSSYTPNSTAADRRRPHSYTAEKPVSADSKNNNNNKMCAQQQSSYTPNSTAAERRRPHSYTAEMPVSADIKNKQKQKTMCGQQQSSYTPNSTAAGRKWRRRPHSYTAEISVSADSKNKKQKTKQKCVHNSSPATHQTLWQQGGTGEDGHIYLSRWTVRVSGNREEENISIWLTNNIPRLVISHRSLFCCQIVSRFVLGPGQICRPFIQFYFNNNKNSNEIFVKRKPIAPTTTAKTPPPPTTTTKEKQKQKSWTPLSRLNKSFHWLINLLCFSIFLFELYRSLV